MISLKIEQLVYEIASVSAGQDLVIGRISRLVAELDRVTRLIAGKLPRNLRRL